MRRQAARTQLCARCELESIPLPIAPPPEVTRLVQERKDRHDWPLHMVDHAVRVDQQLAYCWVIYFGDSATSCAQAFQVTQLLAESARRVPGQPAVIRS